MASTETKTEELVPKIESQIQTKMEIKEWENNITHE
jgi:hypothetical protein